MKRHLFRFSPVLFLFLAVLLSGDFGAAFPWQFFINPEEMNKPLETTIDKIVAEKDSYDGKEVSVSGMISNLKFKTTESGSKYTTFTLVGENGGRINVLISKHPKLKPAQKVKVTGLYRKVKKTGDFTFHNRIEATGVSEL